MIISFELLNPFEYSKTAYFRVIGSKLDTYEVRIKIEEGTAYFRSSDCTCLGASYYLQTKENLKNGKICKHIQQCLNFLERECWIDKLENLDIIK